MLVQSLSVCVPAGCPNNCRFCVSKMHRERYLNLIERRDEEALKLSERDYVRRLEFARDNGCNTVILTGTGEPLLNRGFLERFARWNAGVASPFRWIEVQTSGVGLDAATAEFLRREVGVSTVALSLSNLFDSESNADIMGTPEGMRYDVDELCRELKAGNFNLRLSLNMNAVYDLYDPLAIFERAKSLGADQLTFRKLYLTGDCESPQNRWIRANDYGRFDEIRRFISDTGRELEVLPFGAVRWSVLGMSVVTDDDCMARQAHEAVRYLILRPNCRLYTKWDDEGSLLF